MRATVLRTCWLGVALMGTGCQALPPATDTAPEIIAPAPAVTFAQPLALGEARPMPICLDTVLRLAQDQNGQVQIARAKLQEAFIDRELAERRWLPDLAVGTSYYRHEGGIQDFQGRLIHSSFGSVLAGVELSGRLDPRDAIFRRVEAERKVWQQKGDLSRLTSENLLDAASTYVDLLAAQAGAAVSADTEGRIADLLKTATGLARVDPGLQVEVTRVEAELAAQRALTRKLRGGMRSASAKLTYLLGLDPGCDLVIADRQFVPLTLVDPSQPEPALVEQALARGPGVRELAGLLQAIEAGRAEAESKKWLPAVQVNMIEGAFGAGPGGSLSFDNRFDMGMHLTWNLTDALAGREKRRLADVKTQQVHLSYHDLRAKLTLGVREAREEALSGGEQLPLAEERIRRAPEAYRQSETRLRQGVKGRSPSEVLLAVRSLAGAQLEYIQTLRELDKAQLRLFILCGAAPACETGSVHP